VQQRAAQRMRERTLTVAGVVIARPNFLFDLTLL